MSEEMQNYRKLLQDLEHKAQEQYDKTILMLSGGALGISFTFLKDIVTVNEATNIWLIVLAWAAWTLSCSAILWSFYSSRLAMRQAIKDLDSGAESKNKSDLWTSILNFSAGLLFVIGLVLMITFSYFNLGEKQMSKILAKDNNVQEKQAVELPVPQTETKNKGLNVPEKPKEEPSTTTQITNK